MADQRLLNAYVLNGIMALFRDYKEDGTEEKVTCAEAMDALRHTELALYERVPMNFTERLLPWHTSRPRSARLKVSPEVAAEEISRSIAEKLKSQGGEPYA